MVMYMLDRNTCLEIRARKDGSYNEKFYVGSHKKGIFCRISCPLTLVEDIDLELYENFFTALDAGLLPCWECEPDITADFLCANMSLSNVVANAMTLICDGFLNENSVKQLAKKLYVSERHLRRMFANEMGVSPTKVAYYIRVFSAKKLLSESSLPVTKIAFYSGFNSISEFNRSFQRIFKKSPREYQKNTISHNEEEIFYINYEKNYSYNTAFNSIAESVIPHTCYLENGVITRSFRFGNSKGYFIVEDEPEMLRLKVSVYSENMDCFMRVNLRCQHALGISNNTGNLKLCFEPYELAVRTIIEKWHSEEEARKIEEFLVLNHGEKIMLENGRSIYIHPDREALTEEILNQLPLSIPCKTMLCNFNDALERNLLSLAFSQSYENFYVCMKNILEMDDTTIKKLAEFIVSSKKPVFIPE